MTAKTSEELAKRLDDAGLDGLAEMARADMFHDFRSPWAMPEMELEAALRAARDSCPDVIRKAKIEVIRQDVIEGEFDASAEESDEWAASPDGQEALGNLIREKVMEKNHITRIDRCWIAVSVDEDGLEGLCAIYSEQHGGWMPLLAADEKRLADIRPMAALIAKERNQLIKIVCLSNRAEIETFDGRQ